MKKNKLFLCALASGMLALTGCSDSTDLGQAGGNGANWNADGTGYVSLAINLPQVNNGGSRANGATGSDNDKFNDGEASEYAVDDAILVLFTGATANTPESDYTFEAAYNLPLKFNNEVPAHNQITSTAKITKKIASITSKNIKALVILNPSSAKIECGNPVDLNDASSNTLKIDGTEFTNTNTFAQFCKNTASLNTDLKEGKFMMTNAPLANTPSSKAGETGTKTVKILADLNPENIENTAQEATKNPAAEIYVERSVAKVTMDLTGFTGDKQKIPANTEGAPAITCQIEGYLLDNINTESFIVRNTDGYDGWYSLKSDGVAVTDPLTTQYRFVGNSEVESGKGLYRTYFAKDVNYADEADAKTLTTVTNPTVWSNTDAKLYCLENTFDVEHQTHKNTTRAVLKAKFTVDGVNSATNSEDADVYMYNNDTKTLSTVDQLKANIKDLLESRAEINTLKVPASGTPIIKDESIVIEADGANPGYVKLTQFVVTNVEGGDITVNKSATGTAQQLYKLIDKLGLDKIAKYVNGVGYYTVLIKHFGNDLTPWNTWEDTFTGAYLPKAGAPYYEGSTVTPAATQNYLGRYGVLRNNWYDLYVSSVNRIGTPNIPVPGNEWDDDLESYISVKINILSWAVRKQDVTLQ